MEGGVADAGAAAVAQARDVVLFLAPGFVALKVFQLFGAQRKRSDWEWTTWSVLVAALIGVLPFAPAARLLVGFALGVLLAVAWRTAPKWPRVGNWVVQGLTNSVWDLVLERASREDRVVEVTLGQGDDQVQFFGTPAYFAYEQYEAEPWLYLTDAYRKVKGERYQPLVRTRGVMVHKEQISWLRVMNKE